MTIYDVDTLREKLAQRYGPVVAVTVNDSTTYVKPLIEFMPMTEAIERYDPFQQETR